MIILYIIAWVLLLTVGVAAVSFAPWFPIRTADIDRALNLARLGPGDVLYDLGSGDGRLVRAAARRGACAISIELALPLFVYSWLRQKISPVPGAQFRYGNFFHADLSAAMVVYLFGRPGKVGARLVCKLRAELRPGTRVISYTFPLEGDAPAPCLLDKPSTHTLPLYIYHF